MCMLQCAVEFLYYSIHRIVHVPDYPIFQFGPFLYLLKFLQVLLLPSENVPLVIIFISSYKDINLSIIIGLVMSFPLKYTAVNLFYNILSSCAN